MELKCYVIKGYAWDTEWVEIVCLSERRAMNIVNDLYRKNSEDWDEVNFYYIEKKLKVF